MQLYRTMYCSRTFFCMHLFILCNLLDSYSPFFVFESVFLCILAILAATFCDQLKANTPASFDVRKGKHSLLRRPPAQSLYPYFFHWENAVKLFSCHAHFISEASNYCCSDRPEHLHQELSHGTCGAKAGGMKLS